MPNVKIYVDELLYPGCRDRIASALGPMLDLLCAELTVERQACQIAAMPVMALPGLPPVNVEMQVLPRPERTRAAMTAVCERLRGMLGQATGSHVAVRVTTLDAATYIALK